MALFLLSVSVLVFSLYFYLIDLWYLCFLPLMFFFVLVWYFGSNINFKNKAFEMLSKYSLFIAWIVILGGLALLLHFFGLSILHIGISLTAINLVLRIGSYIFNYKDGKYIFQFGYYGAIVFLLINVFFLTNLIGFFDIFSAVFVAQLGILGFIVFVVGIKYEIEKYMLYKLLFFCIGTAILIIVRQVDNLYLGLCLGNFLLLALYFSIYKILQKKPPLEQKVMDVSVKRILAGERINKKIPETKNNFLSVVYNFLDKMPNFMKYFLEFFNTAIIVILIVSYIVQPSVINEIHNQIFYWLVICCYVLNVFFLKKIGYTNFVQRFLIFLVINFAIYISVFSVFDGNLSQGIGLLLLWNIINNLMVFYTHKTPLQKILQKNDYIYWLVSVFLAMIVNIILLISKTQIPGQLLFALIFVYLGIQSMILFYSIRYVNKKYFD